MIGKLSRRITIVAMTVIMVVSSCAVAFAAGNIGWQKDSSTGSWKYYTTDENYKTGWMEKNGSWYWFNRSGKMKTGWIGLSGKWYYFKESGSMSIGWKKISGEWYYFRDNGSMTTGWRRISGRWYYFDWSGEMTTGYRNINGKLYKFSSSGALVSSDNSSQDKAEHYVNEVIRYTNIEREKAGLKPLIKDSTLSDVAMLRAEEITKKFSHTRPNGSRCFTAIKDVAPGYRYSLAGENIAAGQNTPKIVVEAWMNSPGHRKNILRPGFERIGVGYVNPGNNYGHYWVQMFTCKAYY